MSLPGTPGSWLKLAAPVVLILLLGGYVVFSRSGAELLGHSGYQPFAVKTTTTDGTGHYVFPRVPRGRFYVIAAHSVSGIGLHWAVPVDLVGGAQRLDLSDRNASRPRRQDPR